MTIKIKLSSLGDLTPEGFAERVRKFVVACKEYEAHLEGVKLDATNEDLLPTDRRVAFPGPSETYLIERAAHEGYEFVGPSLDEKKAALLAKVREQEVAAHNEVTPPHKARHWQFRERDILDAHAPLIPTGDDGVFIDDMKARRAKHAQVERAAAKHEHDIGDLTEETVDHYEIGGTFA